VLLKAFDEEGVDTTKHSVLHTLIETRAKRLEELRVQLEGEYADLRRQVAAHLSEAEAWRCFVNALQACLADADTRCPESILRLLTPTACPWAQHWRRRCWLHLRFPHLSGAEQALPTLRSEAGWYVGKPNGQVGLEKRPLKIWPVTACQKHGSMPSRCVTQRSASWRCWRSPTPPTWAGW
jgi:hypothetical protein